MATQLSLSAFDNATVQPAGPRSGGSGKTFFNIQGSNNGNFASFGVADFNLATLTPGFVVGDILDAVQLNLVESNASFTRNGSYSIYFTDAVSASIQPGSAVNYQSGNNGVASVDPLLTNLSFLGSFNFVQNASGAVDNVSLTLSSAAEAYIIEQLNDADTNDTLRLVFTPDEAGVAATYAGQGNFSGSAPTLVFSVEEAVSAPAVFINEIHYDNASTDSGEAIEIAGTAGTDLTGWQIVRYNGNGGAVYTTPAANPTGAETLSGLIPDQGNGFGTVVVNYLSNGLQNGSPDGIALVNNMGEVVQFLSYEGVFTATNGPAAGLTSTDIGIAESDTTPVGFSLQLTGTGDSFEDFTWIADANTFGAANVGQTFAGGGDNGGGDNGGGDNGGGDNGGGDNGDGTDLIITGIIDGPLTGGVPKAVEFFALDDIPDLSIYGFGSANNGGGTDGQEFTFSGSASAGDYIYVASETTGFTSFFGFAPNATSGAASINGDDAIELFLNGEVVDIFGDINVDGTGQPWDYEDGWAYRVAGTGPDGNTFVLNNWNFSSPNALDGQTTNASAPTPFPLATFSTINFQESFESAPGTTYTLSNQFNSGNFVFFDRYAVPDNGNAARDDFQTGWDGSFGILGQDHDGSGLSATQTITIPSIDIAGGSNLLVTVAVGALNSEPTFQNYEASQGDGIQIFATIDGGSRTLIGEFAPPADGAGDLRLDTNADGIGDGTVLTTALTDFSFALPTTGDSLTIEIELTSTGGFEPLAIDNVRVAPEGSGGGSGPEPEAATIPQIQGAGHISEFDGDLVITSGIVTAVGTFDDAVGSTSLEAGFFVQDAAGDGNDATSDAIFVASSADVSVGDAVEVTGTVRELTAGSRELSYTRIQASEVTVESSGNELPAAVILGQGGRIPPAETIEDDNFTNFDPATDGIDFFESIEGMLVTAKDFLATSGTNGFGEIFGVVNNGAEATGISQRGTLNISPDDFNPEKVQIDVNEGIEGIPAGFSIPLVDTGAKLGDVTGVVTYGFGNFEIQPTQVFEVIEDSTLEREVSNLVGTNNQLTVASYNVLNLDPNELDGDTDIADDRFDAIAQQIVNNLNAPDVIGLQEIQDNSGGINNGITAADETLQTLVDAIAAAGGPQYEFIDNTFITDGFSGGQPGANIRTAFLYNPDRVDLVAGSVQTIGSQVAPGAAFAGARLPLVATFEFNGEEVTLVNNHFSSKGGSAPIFGTAQPFEARQEDVSVNGSLDERQAQSAAVQGFVSNTLSNNPEANVVVLGDLNEFEFVSPVLGLESSGLTNLTNTLPENERYTFNFQGNSQSLDHILVSPSLVDGAEFDAVHVNSEFAVTDASAADHDPLLARVALGPSGEVFNGTAGRDNLVGTAGDDTLTGFQSTDTLTGGAGDDVFVYTSTVDAGDTITDFTVGEDQIDLSRALDSVGFNGTNPIAAGYVGFVARGADTFLTLDPDGFAGRGRARNYLLVQGVSAGALNNADNFLF